MRRCATKPEIRVITSDGREYDENEISNGFVNWQPLYDLLVSDDEVMVSIEIAGVGVRDFSIYLTRSAMVIDGFRKHPTKVSRECAVFHNLEIPYGRFNRKIDFPVPIEPKQYACKIENGMLLVRFPVLKERFITIEGD